MLEILKRGLIILFITVLVFVVYFSAKPSAVPKINYSDIIYRNITNTKVILFWSGFFSSPNWDLRFSPRKLQCGNDECIFTNNHSFLPTVEEFDALIFHTARPYPPPPLGRDPKQHYVFAQLESPPNTYHLPYVNNFYNLTMTYRLDSDVLWPYSNVLDAETGQRIAPARFPRWKNSSFIQKFVPSSNLRLQLEKKKKTVAWFVSNCRTISKREKLVKELQKYIQVDIYGKCGYLSCPRNKAEKCNEMLDNDYKFYLSFENSLCIDYVTEKLFSTLNRTVVPIVFGGANYNRFAPPNSYINADDFKTVKELGNFLTKLEKNIDEYSKYYWWKDFYLVTPNYRDGQDFPETYCELCTKLHSRSLSHKTQFYRNIEEYWWPTACKAKPNIKF